MLLKVLCLMLLAVPATVYGRAWQQCEGAPAPRAIRIANCDADNDAYCTVQRNQPAQIQVLFASTHRSQQVRVGIRARVGTLVVPFPIGEQSNMCNAIFESNGRRTRCPLVPNRQYIWGLRLTIPPRAPPGTRVTVQLNATDNNRQIVFCVLLNIQVAR